LLIVKFLTFTDIITEQQWASRIDHPIGGKVWVRISGRAQNFTLVKFVLVLHLQLSSSIHFVLCMPQKFSKVSHNKLPVIYPSFINITLS